MFALTALLEEEIQKTNFCDYVGQSLWVISSMVSGMTGFEASLPQYIELVHPELRKQKQTAEDIISHVLKRLTEG